MAITLTANGYRINSGSEVTGSTKTVNTYECGVNNTRQSIPGHNGSGTTIMWETVTNFTKKSSTSMIVIEGQCVGMDEHSHPYGGTTVRCTHSDGSIYEKYIGSVFIPNTDGSHVVLWHLSLSFLGNELGSKTGNFTINWGYGAGDNSGAHQPWHQEWNWNSNEDGRAQQQGSHTAVYEIEP